MAEVETSTSAVAATSAMPDAPVGGSPEAPPSDMAPASDETETAIATSTPDDAASTSTSKKVVKKVLKKKRRPARPQVDPSTIKTGELPPQTGTIFNIWYNKWSGGDREDKYLSKTAAPGRCSVARDSGYTRADRVSGSFFCLFFARGLCPRGHECEYLHRLPTLHDLFNPNIDAFGRDKHSDYRDDMGGVGSFMRQNRTLYVGRIHVSDDIEEIVARHFAEWGQVERIRVLNSRGVAFITYTNESNAQFAKEAMAHQALDHSEVLNVRWATVDPNPLAAAREARSVEEQAAEAVRRALPDDFVQEIEGRDPEARKRKRLEGGYGLQGYEAPDEVWYARGLQASAGDEQKAIEGAPLHALSLPDAPAKETPKETGLLSSSTLAALQTYSAQSRNNNGFVSKAAPPPPPPGSAAAGGLLVGYGSDDDSD